MLTLRWVMRPPRPGESLDGPVMPADRIIRDAARGVLEAEHPVRVFDGDELVGVVDDEDILRVVVAEDEPIAEAPDEAAAGVPVGAPRRGRAGRSAMTATLERPPTASEPSPGSGRALRLPGTRWQLLAVLVVWVLGWAIWRGQATLEIGGAELTDFHRWLNDVRDGFDAARADSFFFDYIIGGISAVLDATVCGLRDLLSQPSFPRPVPEIGWFGVVALFTWVAYALAGVRSAVLVLVGLLAVRLPRLLGRQHRPADRHVRRGAGLRDHRDPAGHLDGAQQAGQRGDHADPGRDADDALVRLPGAAGPGLRHRPGLGRGHDADLRAAAAGPDHRARHPQRLADHHRGRPVDGRPAAGRY